LHPVATARGSVSSGRVTCYQIIVFLYSTEFSHSLGSDRVCRYDVGSVGSRDPVATALGTDLIDLTSGLI